MTTLIHNNYSYNLIAHVTLQGGIGTTDNEDVIFALEPEAAAIFCEKEILAVNKGVMKKEADYLIVDCGGGTVDIAAHRLSKDDDDNISIKELASAHGSSGGGFSVNHLFEEMLWKLFAITDQNQIDKIKTTYPREWTKLVSGEFEESKCSLDPNSACQEFSISISEKLCQAIENVAKKSMEDLTADYKEYNVSWDDDENALVLKFSTMIRFFEPVVSEIIALIEQSLARPECRNIETVLLVGGFANSSFLFEEVKEAFSPKGILVLKSSTPLLSVLKGAVLYAQKRDIIKSRIMPYSIGIKISQPYDESTHDSYEEIAGQKLCRKVFHSFVKVDDTVKAGSTVSYNFRPASALSSSCKVDVYASNSSDIKYVTDESCYKLGEIIIDNPSLGRSGGFISVVMDFSGTEIKVRAYYSLNVQKELNLTLNFIPEDSFIPST